MKKRIKLSESRLRGVIGEAVRSVLSEMNWKTGMDAARKEFRRNGHTDRYCRFLDYANDRFQDDYGYDYDYNLPGEDDYPSVKGRLDHNTFTDPDGTVDGEIWMSGGIRGGRLGSKEGDYNCYFKPGSNTRDYHLGVFDRQAYRAQLPYDIGKRFRRAYDEVAKYNDGKYRYHRPSGQYIDMDDVVDTEKDIRQSKRAARPKKGAPV